MAEESFPIQELIADAKAAQQRLANGPKVESNTSFLQDRLMKHIKPDSAHEEQEPMPNSLDSIQWHMVDENPADAPLSPHIISQQETKYVRQQEVREARRKSLQKEADECIADLQKPYLRSMINSVRRFNSGSLGVRDWTKRPEELSVMIIELHNYGIGRDSFSGEKQNVSSTIGTAFQVLCADIEGGGYSDTRASWGGIERNERYDDAATEILKRLTTQVKEIYLSDLDVCVMAALSCGDPFTAVRLIQIADQFLPKQGESARASALLRLAGSYGKSSFEKAYELYPVSVKDRLDGVLASLGEGQFANLAEVSQAQELKQKAEKRLRDRLKESRDRWYASQQVTRTDLREQQLDGEHLTDAVEQTIKGDKGWAAIEKIIEEKAAQVVNGQAANSVAAELQRRIHPELALDAQTEAHKAQATRRPGNKIGYGERNDYEYDLYGHDLVKKDASAPEKEGKINSIYYQGDRDLQKELFNPNRIGVKALVALLRNPTTYAHSVQTAIKNWERETQSYTGENHWRDQGRLAEGRTMLARKLVGGVSYLQALAEIPETRQILQQEFGFGDLVNPDNLEVAAEQLQKMFGEVVDQESKLTLYESMLQEGQLDEDTRVARQIVATRPKDVKKIVDVKKGATGEIVEEMTAEAGEQQRALQVRKERLTDPLTQQSEIKARVTSLGAEQRRVEAAETVRFPAQKLLKKGALTEAEKATQLASLAVQIATAGQESQAVEKQITQIGPVDDAQIDAVGKRIASLKKLKPPQS